MRFTELQPTDRIADWYALNEVWGSPNIDSSHRCILRCPQCLRQKKEGIPRIKKAYDLAPAEFKKLMDYYEHCITFCGQISDPIYNPHFLEFLKMLDGTGRGVRIATCGQSVKNRHTWYFGVDGIDEKSELYRIGSNFKEVWETMRLGKSMGVAIVWQYIIFGYNEHEIEIAKQMAKDEGFTLLLVKTNRGFDPKSRNIKDNMKEIYANFPKPSVANTVKKI
jgi:MoaA/NifB/PqqE/SkfB family radical SAM enzyme